MADRYYSVFVGHINPETRKHVLRDLFEKCGPVADVFICPNSREGAYSFGFIRYEERAHAERAVRELHRWEVGGSAIIVQMARDTLEKLKRERAAQEMLGDVRRRPSPRYTVSKSNIVEDSMYLARVKESCTSLGIQSSDVENSISHLTEDIQRADSRKSATQWGPLADPVTNFDHVTEKLIARSQETGASGRMIGAKKAHEFISSLKTIMQEIEDFLCQTANSASGIATELCEPEDQETRSGVGDKELILDGTRERLVARETDSNEYELMGARGKDFIFKSEIESAEEEMRDRKDNGLDQRSGNQAFASRSRVDQETVYVTCNHNSCNVEGSVGINHAISDTESVETERFVSTTDGHFGNTENIENKMVSDGNLDRETEAKVIFTRRVKSLDSGLTALNLTRSPIQIVGTDTEQEVTAEVPKNVNNEAARPHAATFYLTDSLKLGQGDFENISESVEMEVQNTLAANALKTLETSDSEHGKDLDLGKGYVKGEVVQRRARSTGSDLYREGSALPKESLCSFDEKQFNVDSNPNQELKSVVRPKEETIPDKEIEIQRNTPDSRLADSSVLDALFAKLPPLSSFDRSNSQDSSLSDDSFEGIDDSGVESDFRPNYSLVDPQASEQLKSLLGIKPQASVNNVIVTNGSQSKNVNAGSGSLQGLKDFKKRLNPDEVRAVGRGMFTRAPYGRGRMYNK